MAVQRRTLQVCVSPAVEPYVAVETLYSRSKVGRIVEV